MQARTATLRLQLLESVSGPAKKSAAALKDLENSLTKLGRNGMPGAKNLVNQLEHLRQKSMAAARFDELRRGLAQAGQALQTARSRVKELEDAFAGVTKPTAKMKADLRTASSALAQSERAFRDQAKAVRDAQGALRTFSVNAGSGIAKSQQEIRDQLAQTIRKMREMEREAKKTPPASPQSNRPSSPCGGGSAVPQRDVAVGLGGAYVANRSMNTGQYAFVQAVDFDRAVQFRDALGGSAFSPEDRVRLNAQAERIGYETRFTNADVVTAQTSVLQAGVREAAHIVNAMQPITDYALAMGVTLEEGAETVRAAAQIRKVPLDDVEQIADFVDSLVWMAKNGGMNDDDVRQYIRYGGGSMKGLGISDEVAAAMGVVLRRSGVRGDEAGVFARTAAAKLGAPTNPGRTALHSMGLNYDNYVTHPDAFKVSGLSSLLEENFGYRLGNAVQAEIADVIDNGEYYDERVGESLPISSSRAEFTASVVDILEKHFGKMSTMDRKAVSGKVGDFHKFSAESVDSERLLMDILAANPSVAQLNAFFTQRQGNRALMLASNFEQFLDALALMKNTPDGLARQIGTDANKGLYGDWTRATGAVETMLIKIVKDWEAPISGVLKSVDFLASEFTQLSTETRRVIEAMAALAIIGGGFAAMRAGKGLLGKMLGFGPKGGAAPKGAAVGSAASGAAAGGGLKGFLKAGLKGGLVAGFATYFAERLIDTGLNALAEKLYTPEQRAHAQEVLNRSFFDSRTWLPGMQDGESFRDKMTIDAGISSKGRRKRSLLNKLDSETAGWSAPAQQSMDAYVTALSSGGADAEARAHAIGERIKAELSVTGNPDVNTARLEYALNVARQLAAVMRSELGGGPSTNVDGSTVVGGSRSSGGPVEAGKTYAVGGKSPEFFTPSRNGHISPALGGITINLGGIHITGDGGANLDAAMKALDQQLRRSAQIAFGNLQYGDK